MRLAAQGAGQLDGNFNSRTSCEVRPAGGGKSDALVAIATHAPLARCDRCSTHARHGGRDFNSRTSCEVRLFPGPFTRFWPISTHAPLARCDAIRQTDSAVGGNFNSRTSCEVRLMHPAEIARNIAISTHAPLARCDSGRAINAACFGYFNSRTSCEVRRTQRWNCRQNMKFQLTHLLRGATRAAGN